MTASDEAIAEQGRGSRSLRMLLVLVVLAFIGGLVAAALLATRTDLFDAAIDDRRGGSDGGGSGAAAVVGSARGGKVPAMVGTVDPSIAEQAMASRVAGLELRLAQIAADAETAASDASRAEGLLVAAAVRRALDRGEALGGLENQLRLRFGNAQPRAVSMVIAVARRPVTLDQLYGELEALDGPLATAQKNTDFFGAVRDELTSLFVLRQGSTPPPVAEQRLARARRLVSAGNVGAAISEVERLPAVDKAAAWLVHARRYRNARDALDLIENAALFEPRRLRGGAGEAITERSVVGP